jgi:hypothetical protein
MGEEVTRLVWDGIRQVAVLTAYLKFIYVKYSTVGHIGTFFSAEYLENREFFAMSFGT